MGFDVERFADGEVDENFICCICTDVLEDPVESPCRHVFCLKCIKDWLFDQKSCPQCRTPVNSDELKKVLPLFKNLIGKLKIYCDNKTKGCLEIVAFEHLTSHAQVCKYRVISCPNLGCTMEVFHHDLEAHIEACSYSEASCASASSSSSPGASNVQTCIVEGCNETTSPNNVGILLCVSCLQTQINNFAALSVQGCNETASANNLGIPMCVSCLQTQINSFAALSVQEQRATSTTIRRPQFTLPPPPTPLRQQQQPPNNPTLRHPPKASRAVTSCRYEDVTTHVTTSTMGRMSSDIRTQHREAPKGRTGHVAVISDGRMYVYGGHPSDPSMLWKYNISNTSWSSKRTTGSSPTRVIQSQAFVHQQYLYFIGGTDKSFNCSNTVHRLDLVSMEWLICSTVGSPPSPRCAFVCWKVGDGCTIFGGLGPRISNIEPHELYHAINNERGWNNQLYELCLGQQPIWSKPTTTGPTPSPRDGSAHAHINGVGYLFGGWGKGAGFDDLYSYHLHDHVWTRIQMSNPPPARSVSTMSVVDERTLVVCGGSDGTPLSDIWALDLHGTVWRQLHVDNFTARGSHTACTTNDNGDVLVYGGEDGRQYLSTLGRLTFM